MPDIQFTPTDGNGVIYVRSESDIPEKPDPSVVYMIWDGVDYRNAVRYEVSNGSSSFEKTDEKKGSLLSSIGKTFIGVLYRNNTPVSSANSVASNFQTPVAGFTIPAGAMDKDSTLIIDMAMRVFDTVSATRIVRVFADTQQIAAYSFTSTSGLIPMQFRMSNCGDAGAQLQSSGLTINGTEQATVSTRQIDTAGHDTEITITVETPSGQMIKQALFVELK